MENKELKQDSVKDNFTKEEINKILDVNYKSQKLIEKLFQNKSEFDDKVIKIIKKQERIIKILIFVNIATICSIFFLHR